MPSTTADHALRAILTLAQIIDGFDEPGRQTRCMLGAAPCDPARPCTAHERWTAIAAARRAPLTTTTVADLLGDRAAVAVTAVASSAPTARAASAAA